VDQSPCPTCPAAALGLDCPAITRPHPAYCDLHKNDPTVWGPILIGMAKDGGKVPGQAKPEPAKTYPLATIRAAQACPHRVKMDGPCHCFECHGGTRDGEKVDIHQCCACIESGGPVITAPTPDIAEPTPDTSPTEPHVPGSRCSSCPISWPHPCGGIHNREVCQRPRADILALTPWQHSLFQCPDRRAALPQPPRRPDRDGRLRVALFGPCLQGGGAEEWQRLIIRSLDRERIVVVGVGVPGSGTVDDRIGDEFRSLCPVAVGSRECRDLAADADIALCWGIERLDRVLPLVDARPKVVMVSHTDTATPWDLRVHAQRQIDHIAAVSDLALCPVPESRRADTAILANGIDLDRLTPTMSPAESRAALDIPPNAPVLGYIGRPDGRQKDPQALARALVHLSGWYGLWIGGAWYRDDSVWQDCKRIAGTERTRFAGPRRDIGNVLQIMTRFFVPSRWESDCLSALEALASGVPTLMTRHGFAKSHPEWVRLIPQAPDVPGDDGPDLAALVLADCEDPNAEIRTTLAREAIHAERNLDGFGRRWTDYLLGIARS